MGKISKFLIKFFKKIWKTKEEKKRESLLKQYEEGKILKIENMENKNKNGNKKKKRGNRRK